MADRFEVQILPVDCGYLSYQPLVLVPPLLISSVLLTQFVFPLVQDCPQFGRWTSIG